MRVYVRESESRSVMLDSLRPHELYRPWHSPGLNTGVGSHSLLQGIFPTQGSNPGLPHCRWLLYQLSHREAQACCSGRPISSPADLPDPGIEPGFPALQAESSATELQGSPTRACVYVYVCASVVCVHVNGCTHKYVHGFGCGVYVHMKRWGVTVCTCVCESLGGLGAWPRLPRARARSSSSQ